MNWFIGSLQLAGLKLVEQGKITFDTPVSDYLPEFRNPIIVPTQNTGFKPAETVVTLKHLLNFTSGLFYPVVAKNKTRYASKEMHHSGDPASEFFKVVIVRIGVFFWIVWSRNLSHLPGRISRFTVEIRTWNRLQVIPLQPMRRITINSIILWIVVYGWSADAVGFLVEKISGQTLEQFWYVWDAVYVRSWNDPWNSKEHIFDPLNMKASFFLTPELSEKAVNLAYRDANGVLHPWANQIDILEQDSTKGNFWKNFFLEPRESDPFFLVSSCTSRRRRVIHLHEGLSQASPSSDADPW